MKTIVHANVSLALILVLFLLPIFSYAQTDASGESAGLLNASIDLDATDTDIMIEADADAQTTTNSTTSNDGGEVSTENNGGLKLNAAGIAVTSVAQVNSEADLQIFADNLAAEDENLKEVKAIDDESQIEVTYRHSGRLLGMFPMKFNSVTRVNTANNTVEADTRLPWWSFMVTDKSYMEEEIESRIKDNPTIMTSAEVEANAAVKAEIIRAVVAELNAHSSIETAVR